MYQKRTKSKGIYVLPAFIPLSMSAQYVIIDHHRNSHAVQVTLIFYDQPKRRQAILGLYLLVIKTPLYGKQARIKLNLPQVGKKRRCAGPGQNSELALRSSVVQQLYFYKHLLLKNKFPYKSVLLRNCVFLHNFVFFAMIRNFLRWIYFKQIIGI